MTPLLPLSLFAYVRACTHRTLHLSLALQYTNLHRHNGRHLFFWNWYTLVAVQCSTLSSPQGTTCTGPYTRRITLHVQTLLQRRSSIFLVSDILEYDLYITWIGRYLMKRVLWMHVYACADIDRQPRLSVAVSVQVGYIFWPFQVISYFLPFYVHWRFTASICTIDSIFTPCQR